MGCSCSNDPADAPPALKLVNDSPPPQHVAVSAIDLVGGSPSASASPNAPQRVAILVTDPGAPFGPEFGMRFLEQGRRQLVPFSDELAVRPTVVTTTAHETASDGAETPPPRLVEATEEMRCGVQYAFPAHPGAPVPSFGPEFGMRFLQEGWQQLVPFSDALPGRQSVVPERPKTANARLLRPEDGLSSPSPLFQRSILPQPGLNRVLSRSAAMSCIPFTGNLTHEQPRLAIDLPPTAQPLSRAPSPAFSIYGIECRCRAGAPDGPLFIAVLHERTGIRDFASYSITIDWRDGSPPDTGQLAAFSPIAAKIAGRHLYGQSGSYVIQLRVSDDTGRVAIAEAWATVAQG
jgi:hypothetical protein